MSYCSCPNEFAVDAPIGSSCPVCGKGYSFVEEPERYKLKVQRMTTLEEAVDWAIDMFDQANADKRVEGIGSRGLHLKSAIEDLRKIRRGEDVPYVEPSWAVGYSN